MGNCCRIKTVPYKYSDEDQTNQDNISLESKEIITSLSSNSCSWGLVQDSNLYLYKTFSYAGQVALPERVSSLHLSESLLIYAGKSVYVSSLSSESRGILSGHERSVTSLDSQQTSLVTGSADWSVRLWDLQRMTEASSCIINWNVVTSLKYSTNFVIQTSEDLRMRVWDVRNAKISLSTTVATGDNFATSCDFCENDLKLVTGHRGFNGSGCDCKVWDFRKIKEPVSVLNEHSEAVQGVRLVDGKIVSCGKDGKIIVFNKKFEKIGEWVHKNRVPFCCMDRFKDGVLVANIEPRVGFFTLDPLIQEL